MDFEPATPKVGGQAGHKGGNVTTAVLQEKGKWTKVYHKAGGEEGSSRKSAYSGDRFVGNLIEGGITKGNPSGEEKEVQTTTS